jgi:peroxiredoxin
MRSHAQGQRAFPFALGTLLVLSILAGVFVASGAARRAGLGLGLPTDRTTDSAGFHSTTDNSAGAVEKLAAGAAPSARNPALLPVGAPAPAFSLRTVSGQPVALSDFSGKVVLLEFGATSSPQCQAEAEHLVAIRAASSARLVFLAMNADGEDAASVEAFDRHFLIPYPTLLDPGAAPGSPGPVTKSYQVQGYPTFYIIDGGG